MTLPAVPEPGDPSWDVRASHQERDEVVALLRDQLAEGRLDLVEFEERTETAMKARTPRELATVFDDLPVRWRPAPSTPSARAGTGRRQEPGDDRSGRSFVALWLALMVLWWGIWAATSLGAGELLFPWPVFPSLGMGLPVFIRAFRKVLGVEDED